MTSHKNRTFCLKDDFKHDAAFWHVTSPTTFIRRHWHLLLWERKKLYLVGSIAHVDIDTFCCRDTRHPVLLSHIFQLLGTDTALSRHRDALLMTRFVPDFRFLQEPAGSPPTRALPGPCPGQPVTDLPGCPTPGPKCVTCVKEHVISCGMSACRCLCYWKQGFFGWCGGVADMLAAGCDAEEVG